MNFPENIFKAYDIRGIYPTELNEDLVYKIGAAFAIMRQKELGKKNVKLAVGRDMRLSSPALFESFTKGILGQGVDIVDIGLCSTPTFYFAVAYYGYDGGALITASHNPKEYNGVKLVRTGSKPFGKGMGMEELMSAVKTGEFAPVGLGSKDANDSVGEAEANESLRFVDDKKIRKFKIVADTGNAMGATYLEKLFAHLPQIELVKMNWNLDGTFPAHPPDPFQAKNVVDLQAKVVAEQADLGIATDGDGDRIFFVDNAGEILEPAILRGVIAQSFLKDNPGAIICYDIRPGRITKDMILSAGGVPVVTKVGHSFIKEQMNQNGAVFGGESSGHFYVKFPFGVFEAPLVVVVKLLQVLSDSGKNLADYSWQFKKYFSSGEINFTVSDKDVILARLKEKYGDAEIDNLDGLTFTYNDYWFNVRGSNTEPLLRLNLEAKTEELLKEKVGEIEGLIKS